MKARRNKVKKAISVLLAAVMVITFTVTVFAADCAHNYLRTVVEATCLEKSHMLYSCRICGYSYKVYDDTYEAPDSFYLVASTVREESTLTLTVELYNNPGLSASRLPVKYNPSTLALRQVINGDVWTQKDITYIDTTKNPFSFITEDNSSDDGTNENNGVYFTIVFDIVDPNGSYGLTFPYLSGDFPSWDVTNNSIIKHSPKFISLVGRSELGSHSYASTVTPPTCKDAGYTTNVCTVCGDTTVTDITKKTDDHVLTFKELLYGPTITEEGAELHFCSVCNSDVTVPIPALERYLKGDINNDKLVNAIDANLLSRIILYSSDNLQMLDAADINCDGKVNGLDANYLRRKFTGSKE